MGFLVCHWSAKQIILIYAIDWTDLLLLSYHDLETLSLQWSSCTMNRHVYQTESRVSFWAASAGRLLLPALFRPWPPSTAFCWIQREPEEWWCHACGTDWQTLTLNSWCKMRGWIRILHNLSVHLLPFFKSSSKHYAYA